LITFLASIFVFGIIVIFHELGHFAVAKTVGIRVKEFAIGFGPTIVKKLKGETLYSIRALPLGGFVKMSGEDEVTDDERSFNRFSVPARMAVIAAGPIMNFILTVFLFILISFTLGVASNTSEIGHIIPGGRAEEIGLKDRDLILQIDNQKVETWQEVVTIINSNPEKRINFLVKRNGETLEFDVTPIKDSETGRGIIGIAPKVKQYSLLLSIKDGFERTIWLTVLWITSITQIISGRAPAEVIGPVGIVQMVGEAAQMGFLNLIYIAALLSINLGLLNLLPIPALDGSRLIFLAIEGIRKKPIDPEKEGFIHFIGFAILMMLMVFIAYKDILNLNLFR
jgi:regulator of sigma E protease